MKLTARTYLTLALVGAPFLMAQSAPAGCSQDQITASATLAIGTGCQIIADVQAANIGLNSAEQAAIAATAGFCPPNPAPTTITAAVQDALVSVPVLLAMEAKPHPAKAARMRAAYNRLLAQRR